MTELDNPPGPDIRPGELDEETFIERFEAANKDMHDDPDWSLDDDQRRAILHNRGPLRLTAGPGSGKTTVVVGRGLKWLLVDGVRPASIIVTTFTEKAAENLEQRLEAHLAALGYADLIAADELYVGTSHKLWSEIMQDFRYDDCQNVEILDGDAQVMFVLRHSEYVDTLADGDAGHFRDVVPADVNEDGSTTKSAAARAATRLFNRLAQFQVDIDALADAEQPELQRLAAGYRNYCETLRAESRCDFTQLQERFLSFLETDAGRRFVTGDAERDEPPLERLAVDEYQDVNPIQQEIYFRLAGLMPTDRPELTVVGDDDQALYRFRGGTVDCLIEFPERLADFLGISEDEITTEQLHWNYRSRPELVQWVNRHIGDHPTMQVLGARAPGKESMKAARAETDHPSTHLLKGDNKSEAAAVFAEEVERLHENGYIQDYSQVSLLAHSTREVWQQYDSRTFVGECVAALQNRGISVHNPRNKGFLQHEEIQAMLAALARCLDPNRQWAADNVKGYGQFGEQVAEWHETLDRVIARHDASTLAGFIDKTAAEITALAEPGEVIDLSVVDLFNRLRSVEPFATWTSDGGDLNRTERLSKLSRLVETFEGIAEGLTENRQLTRTTHDEYTTVSVRFLSDFYWTFCRYLERVGLDEPEDSHDTQPQGHVQVMTVHQAKGLEFPVVFVASLDRQAEDIYETDSAGNPVPRVADRVAPYTDRTPPVDVPTRAERDLVRQFYVAHSRAEEHLVLLGTDYYLRPADGETIVPALGADAGIPLTDDWFDSGQRLGQGARLAPADTTVGPPAPDQTRRTYSIVGDVLAFRRCKRQYGYHTEHEFAAGSGTQMFAGLAAHQTLDWAHRYSNGDIDGVPAGSIPSEDMLRNEFDKVVRSLRDQRIMPIGKDAIDAVFEHVARFNRTVGPNLYPHVVDTECKLRRNAGGFLLTGVADVIADDGETRLCDYKVTERPDEGDSYLEDYREQLLVYAGLYREKEGEHPDSAVLYFLAEDDPEETKLELRFTEAEVIEAMNRFEGTVRQLEHTRETNTWSEMDDGDLPDRDTCDECDFRWDCPYRDYEDW
jgi:superfamily I DNA/RNA helicase